MSKSSGQIIGVLFSATPLFLIAAAETYFGAILGSMTIGLFYLPAVCAAALTACQSGVNWQDARS